MVMFNVYRVLDILLILYFSFLFPYRALGYLVAFLIALRIVMSYLPDGGDAAVFNLVDCRHHHITRKIEGPRP